MKKEFDLEANPVMSELIPGDYPDDKPFTDDSFINTESEEMIEEPKVEEAPKKRRGRKPKVKTEEEIKEKAAPKKRGRKPKVKTEEPIKQVENNKTKILNDLTANEVEYIYNNYSKIAIENLAKHVKTTSFTIREVMLQIQESLQTALMHEDITQKAFDSCKAKFIEFKPCSNPEITKFVDNIIKNI